MGGEAKNICDREKIGGGVQGPMSANTAWLGNYSRMHNQDGYVDGAVVE